MSNQINNENMKNTCTLKTNKSSLANACISSYNTNIHVHTRTNSIESLCYWGFDYYMHVNSLYMKHYMDSLTIKRYGCPKWRHDSLWAAILEYIMKPLKVPSAPIHLVRLLRRTERPC